MQASVDHLEEAAEYLLALLSVVLAGVALSQRVLEPEPVVKLGAEMIQPLWPSVGAFHPPLLQL